MSELLPVIEVSFNIDSSTYEGLTVEKSISEEGPWDSIFSSEDINTNSISDFDVESGNTYFYRIKTKFIVDGDEWVSDVKEVTPMCMESSLSHLIQFSETPSDYRIEELDQRSHIDDSYVVATASGHLRIGTNPFTLDD